MAGKAKALNEYVLMGTTGLRISPLTLGTMTWGNLWQIGCTKEVAREMFTEYCKAGGNFIDTANKYHEGQSEEWLGEFMAEAGNRDDLIIATKFSLPMPSPGAKISPPASAEGSIRTAGATYTINNAGNTLKNLHVSLNASLRRLRTDYVDVYYVHFWDYSIDSVELMRTLNDLVASRKVLYLGISDAPSWAVAECNAIARARGWAPFQIAQYKYNLIDRSIENDVLNYAVHRPLAVVNWAVLASGALTGKFKRGADLKGQGSARADAGWVNIKDRDYDIIEATEAVAKELGVTPSQVAVAWARQQPGITSPIIGARSIEQYRDNVAALSVTLTAEQLKRLNDISKPTLIFPFNFTGTDTDTCPHIKTAGKVVTTKLV